MFSHQVIDAIGQVVEFRTCRVHKSLHGKIDAVACACAVVDVGHQVTLAGHHLPGRGVSAQPAVVVMRFRSSVYIKDERIFLSFAVAHGFNEQAFDFLPVSGLVADHFLFAQKRVFQFRVQVGQLHRVAFLVGFVDVGRVGWRVARENKQPAVLRKFGHIKNHVHAFGVEHHCAFITFNVDGRKCGIHSFTGVGINFRIVFPSYPTDVTFKIFGDVVGDGFIFK